jgi:hypothetical protein
LSSNGSFTRVLHKRGSDEVARQDIVLEISGRLLCIERQLVELFTGVRGEWRDGATEAAIDMP